MNDNPRANGSRGRDPYAALRLVALIAAIAGVLVLAAAAFVLSYGGIHKIALSAGVSASMARIFPVIFDAMLVVSCAAVLSLRAAGWWRRTYSWLTTLVLLAVVAAADAAHATGIHIPRKPAAATIAVLPWLLLLLAFSLLLSMLRQFRHSRAAMAGQAVPQTTDPQTAGPASPGPVTAGPEAAGPEAPAPATAVAAGTAGRGGLEILERRGPARPPSPASTATQPSAVRPAQAAVDTVAGRESPPPLTRPAGTLPPDTVPAARIPAPPAPAPPAPAPPAPRTPPRRPGIRRRIPPACSPVPRPGPVPPPRPMARARLPLKSRRNEHLARRPRLRQARGRRW